MIEHLELYHSILIKLYKEIENNTSIKLQKLKKEINDFFEYYDLIQQIQPQDTKEKLNLINDIEKFFIYHGFSHEDKCCKCLLEMHCGAGGSDAHDWTEILLNSYLNYFQKNNITNKIIDISKGEYGVKSATVIVTIKMYKILGERGVHRLVRKSPFNTANKRHTSFCSVNIYPFTNVDNITININSSDLKIDTYRAGGAGGQHVNKTDSAVRITHVPSGIVVQCQKERSQHLNKDTAMKILYSKLLQKKKQEEIESTNTIILDNISWGQHFRSYVMDPYRVITDKRIQYKSHNLNKFLQGDIQDFLDKYFLYQIQKISFSNY